MTVTADGTAADTEAAQSPAAADWSVRAGAFGIDVLLGLGVAASCLLVGLAEERRGWAGWMGTAAAAAVLLATAVNRWVLPSLIGSTLGRSVFGIAVCDRDGGHPGPLRLLLRDVAHLLDTVPLFLGWLWPLIDRRGRTFADLLMRTEVHRTGEADPRWRIPAARMLTAGALLAMLVAATGYLTVYRQHQQVARAREQIAVQGPKIVSDMLSYTTKTIADDFSRAQTLVTDSYRPELTRQQDSVRKGKPVDNDYWVTDSAVQSVAPDRATMLLLMQGQRGTAPDQRFITASLRVTFARSASGAWQVDDLTVLTPPKVAPPQAPPPQQKPADQKPAAPKSPAPTSPPQKAPQKAPQSAPQKPGGTR